MSNRNGSEWFVGKFRMAAMSNTNNTDNWEYFGIERMKYKVFTMSRHSGLLDHSVDGTLFLLLLQIKEVVISAKLLISVVKF